MRYPEDFKPAITLLEEGGRQTEADILVFMGHFPSVLYTFVSGDPVQINSPPVFSRLAHLDNRKKAKKGTELIEASNDDPQESDRQHKKARGHHCHHCHLVSTT